MKIYFIIICPYIPKSYKCLTPSEFQIKIVYLFLLSVLRPAFPTYTYLRDIIMQTVGNLMRSVR
jgi:hypothetical protein